MYRIGAHVSIAGGYDKAVSKISDMGGNCLQIFSASPRSFQFINPTENAIKLMKQQCKTLNIFPIYFHASYLINLADQGKVGQLSKQLLIHELHTAEKCNVKGSIIHLGSFKTGKKDYGYLVQNIKEILSKTSPETLFIIENAGNNKIGLTMEEIGLIHKQVGDNRVRICLDTCHLHAAGYDLSTPQTLNTFLDLFDKQIGLSHLELFHINDSRDPFDSHHDRHENIGKGTIDINVFRNILNDPRLKHLPFIIETPGFDNNGPDKKNIDILKGLIQ